MMTGEGILFDLQRGNIVNIHTEIRVGKPPPPVGRVSDSKNYDSLMMKLKQYSCLARSMNLRDLWILSSRRDPSIAQRDQ